MLDLLVLLVVIAAVASGYLLAYQIWLGRCDSEERYIGMIREMGEELYRLRGLLPDE